MFKIHTKLKLIRMRGEWSFVVEMGVDGYGKEDVDMTYHTRETWKTREEAEAAGKKIEAKLLVDFGPEREKEAR